uniref:Uncharacterized protein n=1 Tax=Arundo donax TaxID=35708 RepID=A0A0A8Z5K2_ARUDO
MPSGLGTW